MIKRISYQLHIIIILSIVVAQYEVYFEELVKEGNIYYNQGDYSNAIIIYEDLLAEQELAYENNDIKNNG